MSNKTNKKSQKSKALPFFVFSLTFSIFLMVFAIFDNEDITSILLHLVSTLLFLFLVLSEIKKT